MLKIRGKSCSLSADLVLKVNLTSSANLTGTSDSHRISWQISRHKRQQMLSKTSKRREYNYVTYYNTLWRKGARNNVPLEKLLGIIHNLFPQFPTISCHSHITHASQIFQMQLIVIFESGQNIAQFRKLIWLPNRKYLKTKWHKNRLSKLS